MAVVAVGLALGGLPTWDRWIQLAVMAVVLITVTRLFAPEFFGWTDPED